jgi:hypothetical protein
MWDLIRSAGVLLLLVAGAVGMVLLFGPAVVKHADRLLDSETKLGAFEERIPGIASEFMRRSQALQLAWQDFEDCMSKADCDPASILSRRDRVIGEEWPQIYDRLAVWKDWGTLRDTADSRDTFFEKLRDVGADRLRNRCVPKIEFVRVPRPRGDEINYRFGGFNCREAAHNDRRGLFIYYFVILSP